MKAVTIKKKHRHAKHARVIFCELKAPGGSKTHS